MENISDLRYSVLILSLIEVFFSECKKSFMNVGVLSR